MKSVYFAGPLVFHPSYDNFVVTIKELCPSFSIHPRIPGDGSISSPTAKRIFAENMSHLYQCDLILADITPFRGACVDDGTAFEIGVAAALKKDIYTYSNRSGTYADTVKEIVGCSSSPLRDAQDALIEDFSLPANLMISQAATNHTVVSQGDLYTNFPRALSEILQRFFS
ncbi:nucleoside 2-deoxyribosyltransferase [Chitinivibrio alkaliphilus]|uniref:Nucleoside 2-deoxyribosyltransferase n=1 Tax=Chitinivibrio alkaliphilus ACht1 TaxID=1313304 RepID=U7DAA4_9BACT|nr:nucleoside 2-deoxyribosyltransferase [Chitinivibrio alkaliphilus]ERP38957.1 nucleoside 2-deoxyribosyltransferase [Chitinivibrio alkaliphilus ACht1]